MLVRDPRKRPDAQTILKHEWLTGGAAAPEAPMQPEILNRMKRFAGMNRFKKEALRVRLGRRGTQGGGVVALEGGLTPPVCVDTALLICLVVCASLGGGSTGATCVAQDQTQSQVFTVLSALCRAACACRLLPRTSLLRRLRASGRCSWTWMLTAAALSALRSCEKVRWPQGARVSRGGGVQGLG
jgi:hypothetical protein